MPTVSIISSMATRRILATLVEQWKRETGIDVTLISIGGVDAAKRIRTGEVFDIAVLADDAARMLAAEGFVEAEGVAAFARSPAAVAVKQGAGGPAKLDPANIRELVASSRKIGVSTGPSGKAVRALLQRWGFAEPACQIVEAPAGVPVATLLARGSADVGFQQLSELLGEPGIDILGPVPDDVLPVTVFAMGICRSAANVRDAKALMQFLTTAATAATKRDQGMEPG